MRSGRRIGDPRASRVRAVAVVIVLAAAAADVLTPAELYSPMLSAIALAVCAALVDAPRSRRFLWVLAAVALLLNGVGALLSLPFDPPAHRAQFWINRALVTVLITGIAAIVDWQIRMADRLAAAYAEVDARRCEAEAASVRKTRFFAAVSHDVRTPANAIGLLAEVIRLNADDPERLADLTQRLKSNAVALSELLADVVDATRFDASEMISVQENDFRVNDILDDVCRRLRTSAEAKGLDVETDVRAPVWIRADRVLLTRVLTNLIENAIKYTDAGGVRAAVAAEPDGAVEIAITDTGIGIEPAHLPHVFDEFFQVEQRDHRARGWGLGLATCKRLVEAMHGRLAVRSVVGRGTTFTIRLPAANVVGEPPSDDAADRTAARSP
jgi:signal transduction histidine kinase